MEGLGTAESLIPRFKLNKLLNQGPEEYPPLDMSNLFIDRGGLRVTLLGTIDSSPALLTAERAAFPSDLATLETLNSTLANLKNLGDNDIYRWYLASSGAKSAKIPDLKLNLIFPCTEQHVKKYSPQVTRVVNETPEVYSRYVRPYMEKNRNEGRLNWVFNILEGRTEQEDVLLRDPGQGINPDDGFLLLPDLNWDRKTVTSLHLLGLVVRRDIWSLRDLKKGHVEWLKHMRNKIINATIELYKEVERDMLKLYVHYQPTYYHFHIHVVHSMLEPTSTQATGKAFGLENLISQLEHLTGGAEASMADLDITYSLGEASELWIEIFQPLKNSRGGPE